MRRKVKDTLGNFLLSSSFPAYHNIHNELALIQPKLLKLSVSEKSDVSVQMYLRTFLPLRHSLILVSPLVEDLRIYNRIRLKDSILPVVLNCDSTFISIFRINEHATWGALCLVPPSHRLVMKPDEAYLSEAATAAGKHWAASGLATKLSKVPIPLRPSVLVTEGRVREIENALLKIECQLSKARDVDLENKGSGQ